MTDPKKAEMVATEYNSHTVSDLSEPELYRYVTPYAYTHYVFLIASERGSTNAGQYLRPSLGLDVLQRDPPLKSDN